MRLRRVAAGVVIIVVFALYALFANEADAPMRQHLKPETIAECDTTSSGD